jgi:pimeloyl-ACP methyl ester carboxylesterase
LFAKYVTIDGTAIHYLHTGPSTLPGTPPALDRGHLFLLVHAAGSNAGMWRRQLEALGAEHSAVALDLPGHGRSAGVDGLGSIEEYAMLVERFVGALGLRRCVLVGRSMGGAVALVVACRRPALLRGLVLACTSARFAFATEALAQLRDVVRGRAPQQFGTETFSPKTPQPVMVEAWREQVKTDPRVRWGDLLACQAFDGRALLPRVGTPTLVVAGMDDAVTPISCAEELARGIPGARLSVLEAAGHQAPLEQADAVNRLLVEFAGTLGR